MAGILAVADPVGRDIAGIPYRDEQVVRGIAERGHLREGYFADLVLVDPEANQLAEDGIALAKCGWTPFDGHRFRHGVASTWVNGELAWDGQRVLEGRAGRPLVCDSSR